MDYQAQAATNVYNAQAQASGINKPASRLQSDIDRLLTMVKRVHLERERLQAHNSSLGYFAETPATADGGKIEPISNTLTNALNDLDIALTRLQETVDIVS